MSLLEKFDKFRGEIPSVRPSEVALYEGHFQLLCSWNEHIGLVSRKSIGHSFANHYIDSIYIADFAYKHAEGKPIIDIGSGAGFPGIIFAIRYPQKPVRLFEKMLKKQSFLSAVVAQLKLSNVTVSGAVPNETLEGLFLGRAVFPRAELFPFLRKHISPLSLFIAASGGLAEPEATPEDFPLADRQKYTLPEEAGSRYVECIRYVPRGTVGAKKQ